MAVRRVIVHNCNCNLQSTSDIYLNRKVWDHLNQSRCLLPLSSIDPLSATKKFANNNLQEVFANMRKKPELCAIVLIFLPIITSINDEDLLLKLEEPTSKCEKTGHTGCHGISKLFWRSLKKVVQRVDLFDKHFTYKEWGVPLGNRKIHPVGISTLGTPCIICNTFINISSRRYGFFFSKITKIPWGTENFEVVTSPGPPYLYV